MSLPTLQVTIVDSADVCQTFQAQHVEFDCDSGHIVVQPGNPDFCQGFVRGVLRIEDGLSVTRLNVTEGLASLVGNTMNVVCGRASLVYRYRGEHPFVHEPCPGFKTGAPPNTVSRTGDLPEACPEPTQHITKARP